MHHFVLASHASICSCIVCINSFIAYHKNGLEILNYQRYFISFTDGHTRYMYLYLLYEMAKALDAFKTYKAEV